MSYEEEKAISKLFIFSWYETIIFLYIKVILV